MYLNRKLFCNFFGAGEENGAAVNAFSLRIVGDNLGRLLLRILIARALHKRANQKNIFDKHILRISHTYFAVMNSSKIRDSIEQIHISQNLPCA